MKTNTILFFILIFSCKVLSNVNNTIEAKKLTDNIVNAVNKNHIKIYNQISNQAPSLNKSVFFLAMQGYDKIKIQYPSVKPVITLIDYSLPSHKKRLWVIDLLNNTVK